MASTKPRARSGTVPIGGARLRSGLRNAAFVVLSGAVVGVGSERAFWYWTTDPLAHVEIALFYAPAVAFALWAVERYRVGERWSFLLAVPLFGYWVEGVITPIIYSGGPFVPVFPLWFTGWHGLFALVVLWYLVRRWLVEGRWRPLLVASVGVGLFWGAWAITLTLPENVNDPELIEDAGAPLQILDPSAFARYVVIFTVILAGAHYLLGRVWVTSYRPGRVARWPWLAATGLMLVVWSFAYPWAVPMFAAYVGVQLWALRRHAASLSDGPAGPSLLSELDGRVPLRSLWPLAAIPLAAAPVYAALWELGPSDEAIRAWMYTVIALQSLLASGAIGYSLYRVLRRPAPPAPQPPLPPPARWAPPAEWAPPVGTSRVPPPLPPSRDKGSRR